MATIADVRAWSAPVLEGVFTATRKQGDVLLEAAAATQHFAIGPNGEINDVTNDLSKLGLAPGHSFVAEAHGDVVADTGIFGPDPNQMKGITNLSTQAGTSPDGVPRGGSDGHSQYFNDRTMSQYNMAVVAAGLPNLTVQGTDRGIADIAQTPVPGWLTGGS